MTSKVTWVLIADGATAKVFSYDGDDGGLSAVEDLMFSQAHLRAQDINTDRDRGTFSGSAARGFGRSGYDPQTDPVEHREANFVKSVVEELETRLQRKEFDRLVIAAAPTALGDIRPQLSKALQATVAAEIPKDLTNSPTPKLEEQLRDVLKAA